MFAQQCTRQLSASPPPVFSYPSISPYDAYRQSPYTPSPIYHAPGPYSEIAYQSEYEVPSLVPVLPSMQRKQAYDEDLSPFSMSYANMAGIELCQAQAQSHPQPSTLPVHYR